MVELKTLKDIEKDFRKDCDFLLSLIKHKLKISDEELKGFMIYFDKNYSQKGYKLK